MPKKKFKNDHPLAIFKKSPIHGWGGFARTDIRKGKRIIEYVGEKLTKEEAEKALEDQNCYVFTLNDEFDLDGSVSWNPARYINHSCAPNCKSDVKRDRVWIYAIKNIKKGEELTYNYGHDLDEYLDRLCHCGSENCVGYMVAEEHFDTLKKLH
ncbi:MAG: hypothetical protein M2R45_01689 [Verrucomicrobia subdivision 3 bacterium]|nr:hypothetical protein [Limisphaerales bacterium]MCS1413428.1 hypothetical protein [Limisphaerales bacterium]